MTRLVIVKRYRIRENFWGVQIVHDLSYVKVVKVNFPIGIGVSPPPLPQKKLKKEKTIKKNRKTLNPENMDCWIGHYIFHVNLAR